MPGKKKYSFFLFSVIGLVLLIGWHTFSQPGVQQLEGDFKRLAFFKNENNTGPVERVYAISTSDTLWQEMQKYGELMPHTKYGNTKVYFFSDQGPSPRELVSGKENMDQSYHPHCLAKYEKDAMGNISFIKHPFPQ